MDNARGRVVAVLMVSLVALFVGGCGGSSKPSASSASGSTGQHPAAERLTSSSCSASEPSTGGQEVRYCEYVLADRKAFKCNMAQLRTSKPTVAEVEHGKGCVSIGRVSPPRASAAVEKAIAKAQACLMGAGFTVSGGPVSSEGHGPGGPEGELITNGALIGFYADARLAQQAESGVLKAEQRAGATIDRHNAVTVVWLLKPGTPELRARVEHCVFT